LCDGLSSYQFLASYGPRDRELRKVRTGRKRGREGNGGEGMGGRHFVHGKRRNGRPSLLVLNFFDIY